MTGWIAICLQGRRDNVLYQGISAVSLIRGGLRHTVFPFPHSTTNLCCNMTRSRSPTSYFISPSNRAHKVSRRFPALGCTFSEEKNPIHLNPEIIRLASTSSGKFATSLIRATRSLEIAKFVIKGKGCARRTFQRRKKHR